MDIPSSVQSCGGIRIRLTCIIPYKSCPLFALCSDPTNCRLCPSTFLISGPFSLRPPPGPPCCPPWPWHVSVLHGIDNYTHIENISVFCCLLFCCHCCSVWARRGGGDLSIRGDVKFNPDCQKLLTHSIVHLHLRVSSHIFMEVMFDMCSEIHCQEGNIY